MSRNHESLLCCRWVESPCHHLRNLECGASAGAATGLVLLVYCLVAGQFNGSDDPYQDSKNFQRFPVSDQNPPSMMFASDPALAFLTYPRTSPRSVSLT